MDILDDDLGAPSDRRLLPVLARCLFLVACVVVSSAVAEYLRLLPVGQQRGLGTSVLVGESFKHFDPAMGLVGLLVGIAALAAFEWTRRGRSAV